MTADYDVPAMGMGGWPLVLQTSHTGHVTSITLEDRQAAGCFCPLRPGLTCVFEGQHGRRDRYAF
jgi:hypothetical protein